MLNFQLMRNPANWFIVTLMLIVAGIAGHLALTFFGVSPASDSDDGSTVPKQVTPATQPVVLGWDGTFNSTAAQ